jgi:uncharacterized protein (TIGR02996 family)
MEQAFLRAILERPGANADWLVMADWLEENGHGPRAELVRLQVELRQETAVRARSAREKRVQRLLAEGVRPLVPTITNSIGVVMALVPPGVFFMGSPSRRPDKADDDDEFPRRLVRITRPFFLGVCELTQGQYESVMGTNPSYFAPGGGGAESVQKLDHRTLPVENVSYLEIIDFCRRLSEMPLEKAAGRKYRLPTEAEWEYACRGCVCHTAYSVGSRLRAKHARFDGRGDHPVPVGSYAPNLFGMHDMHGNVWEWCNDWYDGAYYRYGPPDDPPGPSKGTRRVLRGGGWSTAASLCRSALRGHNTLDAKHNYNGFRLAMSVPEIVSGT